MSLPIQLVYFSNVSENTKRFVEKLTDSAIRIPLKPKEAKELTVSAEYVLVFPTYGGGSEAPAIPKPVKEFLNNSTNRNLLRGVIGMGNTNFGNHYCKAADLVVAKTGVPLIARVELMGTTHDVEKITRRLTDIYG